MGEFEKLTTELQNSKLPLIVYGAGNIAEHADMYLKEYNIDFDGYAVDKEYLPEQKEYLGKPMFVLGDYIKRGQCNVLSAVSKLSDERLEQLNREENINKVYLIDYASKYHPDKPLTDEDRRQLSWLREVLCDEISKQHLDAFVHQKLTLEYGKPVSSSTRLFDSDILSFSENEVYVDCGAYDGDTILGFVEAMKRSGISSYKKIFAFEPDPGNLLKIDENTKNLSDITVIPKGLYDKTCTLYFSNEGNQQSKVDEEGNKIEVTTIDEIIKDENCTFIKVSFLGSELKCLMGAEKAIKRCRPKLAVNCLFIEENLTAIPQYIKSVLPDYKLYFRNYSQFGGGSVLYAV